MAPPREYDLHSDPNPLGTSLLGSTSLLNRAGNREGHPIDRAASLGAGVVLLVGGAALQIALAYTLVGVGLVEAIVAEPLRAHHLARPAYGRGKCLRAGQKELRKWLDTLLHAPRGTRNGSYSYAICKTLEFLSSPAGRFMRLRHPPIHQLEELMLKPFEDEPEQQAG
jgi:hypothetical protein